MKRTHNDDDHDDDDDDVVADDDEDVDDDEEPAKEKDISKLILAKREYKTRMNVNLC
jgi:hypothetical protein